MKSIKTQLITLIPVIGLLVACGAVKDKANEISNDSKIQGHWLMTEAEHSSKVEKALENESVVLTFKDSKAAFSPTDTVKGRAVFALLSKCETEVRPYKTDKNQIVFAPVTGCAENRITVQTLDATTLKFPDPQDGDVTRTFRKISDEIYATLVKSSERRP